MNVQDFMNLGEVGQTPSFEGDIKAPAPVDLSPYYTKVQVDALQATQDTSIAAKLPLAGGALTGAVTTPGLTAIGNSSLRVRSGTTEAIVYYDAADFYILFTDSVGASFNSTRALRASRNGNLYTQGDMIASGTVWAGGGSNGRMGADGNLWGTAYGSDWLTNYIENRGAAYANDRAQGWGYVQNAIRNMRAWDMGSIFTNAHGGIAVSHGGTYSSSQIGAAAGSWYAQGTASAGTIMTFLRYA
jgi:hypothetical protein